MKRFVNSECSTDGCDRKARSSGRCHKCYKKWRRAVLKSRCALMPNAKTKELVAQALTRQARINRLEQKGFVPQL